ncbi:MAG: hypothetical protein ACTSWQ_02345 [Candidatus Thorarchaeota archaeon]
MKFEIGDRVRRTKNDNLGIKKEGIYIVSHNSEPGWIRVEGLSPDYSDEAFELVDSKTYIQDMSMEEVEEYLDNMKKPFNVNQKPLNDAIDSLYSSFIFGESDEGQEYWNEVTEKLEKYLK